MSLIPFAPFLLLTFDHALLYFADRASSTVIERPLSLAPLNCAIALSVSSFPISRKPKPFERPVARSVMMLTDSTCPTCSDRLEIALCRLV